MRFLVACGVAIIFLAAARTIDVLQSPAGARPEPPLWLAFVIGNFVRYGVGLAMLFFGLAAHLALPAAARHIANRRAALGLAAIAAGVAIAASVPLEIVNGLASIIPEERSRFQVVAAVSNLHLVANGLLLIALGVRLMRITPPAAA